MKTISGKYHRIYLALLVAVWAGLLFQLRQTYFADGRKAVYLSLATGLHELPDEIEWMNILLNGKKVGHSYSAIKALSTGGYAVENMIDFNTIIAGMPVRVTTTSHAETDSEFHYRSFDWQVVSGFYSTSISGEISGGKALIRRIEAGDTTSQEIPLPQEIYPSQVVRHLLAQRGIRAGEQLILPVYEPLSRETVELVITHEGRADLQLDSATLSLNKIRIMYGDLPTWLWLDDNGIAYREEGLLGLVLERTTVQDAMTGKLDFGDLDLAEFYAVPVRGKIDNPRQVGDLTLTVSGIGAVPPPALVRYQVSAPAEDQITVHLSNRPRSLDDSDSSIYTTATALIQADSPLIGEQAREIVGDLDVPLAQVRALTDWVYRSLDKVAVANLASAVEILKQRQGDCSEHTTLFTALARNRGIPTRIFMGLVYLDGKFLYHAWPAVLLDEGWLAVDPTFGQVPADATHLPLLEGDFSGLSELAPLLGRISLIVEDYQ
ncbi:MAG: transglutaminase domain-containing protein [Candidatus Neomarinimicrobiota bacterium]